MIVVRLQLQVDCLNIAYAFSIILKRPLFFSSLKAPPYSIVVVKLFLSFIPLEETHKCLAEIITMTSLVSNDSEVLLIFEGKVFLEPEVCGHNNQPFD